MRKENILNILGFLIGILGIILSVYYYELSKREKEPTFIIDPIKFEILKSSSTHLAPIKILTLDSTEIKGDVTSLTFYFWNKGKEPLKSEDLLSDINLFLSNNSKIIDFKILKSSREVCKIKLLKQSSDSLKVDFKILEENDGFTGQIIFEGSKSTQLNIAATIVGVKNVSDFAASKYYLLGKTIANILLGIVAIFVMFIFGAITTPLREPPEAEMMNSKRYKEDDEYRKKVDEIANLKANEIQLWTDIREFENNNESEKNKNEKSTKGIIKIGIIIGITIVLGILITAWYITKEEIIDNPVNYIPESIRPK